MSQNQIIAAVAALIILLLIIGWAVNRRAVRKRRHRRHSRHLRSNRRLHSRSSPNSVAAADVNLSVKVQGDEIVVTLPGTSYVVTSRHSAGRQKLSAMCH